MDRKNKIWTKGLEDKLIELYPNNLTQDIADRFQMKLCTIRNAAHRLGLKKDKAWISKIARERTLDPNHGGRKFLFQKGSIPKNKGLKQSDYMSKESIEKSKKSRFKKGNKPHNAFKDWEEVLRKDSNGKSYWRIKVQGSKRLVYKNVWLWELHNGKIPKNHVVVFKDGNTQNCIIENLECISRVELMNRNTIHQYPEELKETIRLKNKINKKIKEKS